MNFPSLEGDLFVVSDHADLMSFLIDCGNYLISVSFNFVRPSETFIWSKGTPFLSKFTLA